MSYEDGTRGRHGCTARQVCWQPWQQPATLESARKSKKRQSTTPEDTDNMQTCFASVDSLRFRLAQMLKSHDVYSTLANCVLESLAREHSLPHTHIDALKREQVRACVEHAFDEVVSIVFNAMTSFKEGARVLVCSCVLCRRQSDVF
jgi:hypothetical protein